MESVMNHRDYTRKYSVNISEVKEKALNTLVAFGCILRPRLVKQKTIVCLLTEVNPQIGKHTSELQSHSDLVCRLLLEKKKNKKTHNKKKKK